MDDVSKSLAPNKVAVIAEVDEAWTTPVATRATAAFDAADARSLIDTVRVIAREIDFGPTEVIVADDMTYGMLRMLEVLLEGVCDVRPFRNAERNSAEQWIRTMPIRPRIKS